MKRKKLPRNCLSCSNMIPIGEGDHICLECGDEPVMVVSDYQPTEEFCACKGKHYDPN